jgi:putative phosphoribosyl transferase
MMPETPLGLAVFVHGSGSSRFSPRNRFVADGFRQQRIGSLLLDLLTPEEEVRDEITRSIRFDIDLLARRVIGVLDELELQGRFSGIPMGLFGASTGAAAALIAAAERPQRVRAVVSRGGRADLAEPFLGRVRAPTLLIVGELDRAVIELNERALRQLHVPKRLEVVPLATHLFEEPGALEQVTRLAASWLCVHFEATAQSLSL